MYSGNGILVQDYATWVGMNLNITGGGVITRRVRGRDDFVGYYNDYQTYPPQGTTVNHNCIDSQTGYNWGDVSLQLSNHSLDGEPDLFTISLPGYSGQFMFKGRDIINLNHDDTKIELLNISGVFKVILPNGVSYFFGGSVAHEVQTVLNPDNATVFSGNISYSTAYYLTKILAPSGQEITYTYTYGNQVIYNKGTYKTTYSSAASDGTTSAGCAVALGTNNWDHEQRFTPLYLTTITFPNGRVSFNTSSNRCDLPGAKRMETLIVYNNANAIVKKFSFHYSYDQTIQDQAVCSSSSARSKDRMWLMSVRDVSADQTAQQYTLKYMPGALPSQVNRSENDDWGYYGRVNKVADSVRVLHGMLYSITYPTGGTIVYNFESHDYFDPNYYTYQTTTIRKDYQVCLSMCTMTPQREVTFTISDTKSANLAMEFQGLSEYVQFRVFKNNSLFKDYYIYNEPPDPNVFRSRYENLTLTPGTYKINAFVRLCDVENVCDQERFRFHLSYIESETTVATLQKKRIGGGVRIGSILHLDERGNKIKGEYYRYKDDEGRSTGKLLNPPIYLRYGGLYMLDTDNPPLQTGYSTDEFTNCGIKMTSDYDLGDYTGPNVGYSTVTIFQDEAGNNGKEVLEFSYNDGGKYGFAAGSSLKAPSIPFHENKARGLLSRKRIFKKIDNMYQLQQTKSYSYDISRPITIQAVMAWNDRPNDHGAGIINLAPCDPDMGLKIAYYNVFSTRIKLTRENTIKYEAGREFTEEINNFYESTKHDQLTKQTQQTSPGPLLEKRFTYTADYSADTYPANFSSEIRSGIYNDMRQRNLLFPVEERVVRNGLTTVITINQHSYFDSKIFLSRTYRNTLRVPVALATIADPFALDQNTFSLQNSYYYYRGDLVEITDPSGVSQSFLWSPTKRMLGHLVNVPFTIIQEVLNGDIEHFYNPASTQTLLISKINNFRTLFPASSSSVKSFEYSSGTYTPIFQPSKVTDANGLSTSFEFDAFARLKSVRDQNNHMLRVYKYALVNE